MVTAKQQSFILKLAIERNLATDAEQFLNANPSVKEGSRYIQTLLDMHVSKALTPKSVKVATIANGLDLSNVRSGYYAAEDEDGVLRFFKVDNIIDENNKWEGWVFVKIQAGDDLYKQGNQKPNALYTGKSQHALKLIAANPLECSKTYGRALGSCGVCGRTLTDPESIADGIGPICKGRLEGG